MIRNRLEKVQEQLAGWGVSALLIQSGDNRRWLSGFTGSAGWLLISAKAAFLATDSRYWDQAERQAPDYALFRLKEGSKVSDLIAETGVARVGVEAQHLTLQAFSDLQKNVEGVEWKPLAETVEPWRAVKSPAEVAQIRRAAAISDRVLHSLPTLLEVGQTEQELAWLLEKSLRESGADALAFPLIVASGPNAALPHHRPGERRLAAGDTLVVDMGASVNGYKSDITRSCFLGDEPPAKFWEVYHLTLAAQQAALEGVRAGMSGREADRLARAVIADAGYGEYFGHGLGHGVGLAIHEEPRLSPRNDDGILPAGSVITVEPGIYLPGWGGVRLEDLVLLTEEGAEVLSRCPKEPVIPIHG